jgi:hydrogenase expression/formation protein HypC
VENMCLAIPGKIIKCDEKTGTIDMMGVTRDVSLELIKGIKIGDYVLVHAGCAIQKIDLDEALESIKLFEELKEITGGKF